MKTTTSLNSMGEILDRSCYRRVTGQQLISSQEI